MVSIPNDEPLLSSTQGKSAPLRSHFTRNLTITLLASAIIASAAYVLYTNQQRLTHQIQTLNIKIVDLNQQQTNTNVLLETKLGAITPMQTELNNRLDAVNKNLSNALEERWYQANDWLLLKARYYLELAAINAHWSEEQQTTVALFKQADDLLANIHKPELFAVRQAMAQEIAQLQAIPTVDTVGLLSKLDAAQLSLTKLPLKNPFALTKNRPMEAEVNKTDSIWCEQVQKSMQLLEKLVLIRHHDETIEPLMSPEYESLLRETCFLNLQEAQWAVIQRNNEVYKLSLNQAINTIKRTFDLKSASTQTLLQQLNELQPVQLNSQKISTGKSLSLLNQLIESKKNNIKDVESPVAGASS